MSPDEFKAAPESLALPERESRDAKDFLDSFLALQGGQEELEEAQKKAFLPSFLPESPRYPSDAPEQDKFRLILILCVFHRGTSFWKEKGFPEELCMETFTQDLHIWLAHHAANFGFTGLEKRIFNWLMAILKGEVLSFGRLQCNSTHAFAGKIHVFRNEEGLLLSSEEPPPEGTEVLLAPGDPAVNLHIPEKGPLLPELCIDSIRKIMRFFEKYSPDYHYKAFVCYSWLLDPQLRKILPPGSNILKFQNLGHAFPYEAKPESMIERVFGCKALRDGVNKVPHTTSMQKRLAAFLDAGGVPGGGGMFILREEAEKF